MTPDIHVLIQAEVDGQNTPEASRQLADLCREDTQVQQELSIANAVARALDKLSDARVPDGFAANVMEALPDSPSWSRHRAPVRAPQRASIRLNRQPWMQLAYGMVVGVFVTFAVMTVLQPDTAPIEGASGTMIAPDSPSVTETVEIGDGNQLDITIQQEADRILAHIDGTIADGVVPSLVIDLPEGERVVIPLIQPGS